MEVRKAVIGLVALNTLSSCGSGDGGQTANRTPSKVGREVYDNRCAKEFAMSQDTAQELVYTLKSIGAFGSVDDKFVDHVVSNNGIQADIITNSDGSCGTSYKIEVTYQGNKYQKSGICPIKQFAGRVLSNGKKEAIANCSASSS